MQRAGHEIIPYFGPNARLAQALYRAAVDAIAPAIQLKGTEFVLSEPYLTYDNVAMALAYSGHRPRGPADLAGLRVMAFQRARHALGAEFAAVIPAMREYHEAGQQQHQAIALLNDRVDVVIGERRVLLHHLQAAMQMTGHWRDTIVRPVLPTQPCAAAFREAAMASGFNDGLRQMQVDGTYKAILDRYPIPDWLTE